MDNLHALLTWSAQDALEAFCTSLRNRHQGHIALEISKAIQTFEARQDGNTHLGSRVRTGLGELSEVGLNRVIDAPETCYRVSQVETNGVDQLVQFLETAIRVEWRRESGDLRFERGAWSALADLYYPPVAPSVCEADGAAAGWLEDASRMYCAPSKNGLVIDYFSPYAARPIEANNFRPQFAAPTPYTASDAEAITLRIFDAMDGLQEGCPVAEHFVQSLLRTVMPRPEPVVSLFKGGSNRAFMGRVNLYNPHLHYLSSANIATSLVHEGIHTCLYMIERSAPPALDHEMLYYHLIESPWSGKRIHLLAFIHASFVWYGLHRFWSLPAVQARFDQSVRDYYLAYTRRGFTGGQMFSRLEPFAKHLRTDLTEQLREIQTSML